MSSPCTQPRIATLTIAFWFRRVVGIVKIVLRGKHKKLILSLLLITLVIAGVFAAGQEVFAQTPTPPPTPPTTGNAILQQALGSQSWWFGLMLTIVIALQAIFAWLIIFASLLLNVAFSMNLGLVPSALQVVQTGWVVLRDLVNGIFILLVLWIALTIILGIEQYGGKRLLAKVLAVAILINFSLAIVTAIVAFSNQFALAFSQNMGGAEKDPAGFFITTLHINTTTNQLSPEQAKALADAKKNSDWCKKAAAGQLNPIETAIAGSDVCNKTIGAKIVNAGLKVYQTSQQVGEWSTTELNLVVQGVIGLIIIFVVTSAFLYGAIALLIRYFAILLLTIASPIAFITVALPMNLGKSEGWDYWWKEFMKWVFFAPAFYFLMYLAMLMATQYKNAFQAPNGLSAINVDGQYIFAMVIVLGLLVFASRFAKKTSGKIGEVTVGLGKKLTGLAVGVTAGVATGGTLLAARGLARGMVKPGTKREAFLNKAASKPWARALGAGALQRAGVRGQAERKADVDERKKQYASMSNDQLLAQQRGSLGRLGGDARNNAAMLSLLAERGVLSSKNVTSEERAKATTIMSRYGMASDINKIDATTTTKKTLTGSQKRDIAENNSDNTKAGFAVLPTAPVQFVAQNLTAEEIKNAAPVPLKGEGAANKEMLEGLARNKNFGTTQLRDLALKDIEAAQKFVNHMSETTLGAMRQELRDAEGITDQALKVKLKATLGARIAQIEGMAHYLDTSTGGRVLGLDLSQAPAMRTAAQRRRRRGQNSAGDDEEGEEETAPIPPPPGQNTTSFG